MTIKLGTGSISKLYLGSTEINQMYLGATEVYSAVTPVTASFVSSGSAGGSLVGARTFTSMSFGSVETGRLMVAVIGYDSAGGTSDITAVTIGGTSASFVAASQTTDGRTVEIWSASGVSGTSGNVAVTVNGSGSFAMGVAMYKVMNAGPVSDTDGQVSSTDTIACTIDKADKGATIAGSYFTASNLSSANVSWTGATEDVDIGSVGNAARRFAAASIETTTASAGSSVQSVCSGSSGYSVASLAITYSPA